MALTLLGCILSSVTQPYGFSSPGPDARVEQVAGKGGSESMHSEFVWLTVCRFILGVGVGGVYPLAATVAAESSGDNKSRGIRVSVVFSTQVGCFADDVAVAFRVSGLTRP
jgi:MFS family permease